VARRILIIDDDADMLLFLATLLEDEGYQALPCSDGQQGLALARAERPDLALLDLQMPGLTGVGVYRELTRDPVLRRIPVVMVTAVREFDLFAEGCRPLRRPSAVVEKPVDRRALLEAIRCALAAAPSP